MNKNLRHHLGWWLLFHIILNLDIMKISSSIFSIKDRLRSFKYALNGFKILLLEEHNFRIHILASVLVIITSLVLQINRLEWTVILLSISIVLVTETINTAIENLANFVSPKYNTLIKKIKDLTAAAVLIASIIAFVIAIIIFIPNL